MLQKLACLAVVAGGMSAFPVLAQFQSIRDDGGALRSGAFASTQDMRLPAMPSASISHAVELEESAIALSDSERFQLRQQIRDAAQDIYAAPLKKSAAGPETGSSRR